MEDRLQKILSRSGLGSRRKCEKLIIEGQVMVNDKLAIIGMKADPDEDTIIVDGQPIKPPEPKQYIALNKPRGVLSSVKHQDARPIVCDLVETPFRVFPVGRLDKDSEGLILLTNDGKLTQRLTHPRYAHEKEYRVLVARHPEQEQLNLWEQGITLNGGAKTLPAKVRIESFSGKGAWLRIILREGRKHQIRDICAYFDLPVVKLIRIRIATLTLGSLKPGEWKHLTFKEISALKNR